MDLTDVTISPMIPVGVAVVSAFIKTHTGWGWVASIGIGLIPGAVLGFVAGLLLFLSLSGVIFMFVRLFGHRTHKPPD